MKRYHILFTTNLEEVFCKGEDFLAMSAQQAIDEWEKKYKDQNCVFLVLYTEDMVNNPLLRRPEISKHISHVEA